MARALANEKRDVFRTGNCGAVTSKVSYFEHKNFTIIDTPGLDHPLGRDNSIVRMIESCAHQIVALSCVIVCIENLDRFQMSLQNIFSQYCSVLGGNLQNRLIVCVNKHMNPLHGEKRPM